MMHHTTRIALTLSLALTALLSGCGDFNRTVAKATGFAEDCVDGVVYLQFSSGATVKYRPDGKIWTCGS